MKSLASHRWIRSLIQSWLSQPARLKRNARTLYRLQIETLEDRVVPSNWLVTNTSNSSSTSGSLPWAVAHANTDTSNADITFSPTAFPSATTITLAATLTLSNTAHSITIDGSGAGPITVSGGGSVEDFSVNASVTAILSNFTIANGHAGFNGGGISNAGNLTLTNDVLTGNLAGYEGGGLYNTGTAAVSNVTLTNNAMQGNGGGFGGGIFSSGSITIANSVFTANTSAYSGSAISGAGTMVVTNTTFSNNVASYGAMEVHDVAATVIGCTFTGNTSSNGGAVWMSIFNGPTTALTMVDCTLTGNATHNQGGAIAANNLSNLSLNLTHCTLVGNTAMNGGGGVYIGSSSTPTTLVNTIVAGNTVHGSPSDISGAVSGSNNLIGTGAGMTGITNGTNGNQVGTSSSPINPLLNSLSNNGGPTQTMSEQTGSPAIGAGGAVTTLSIGVADTTTTTITPANLSGLAASALPALTSGSYFTIQIDSEQMAVTAASSTTLTVVRGVNGTSPAMHASGAPVYVVSDQRSYLVPENSPPVVDKGAYQSMGINVIPVTPLSFTGQPTSTFLNASLGTVSVADVNGGTPVVGAAITITISSGAFNGIRTAITNASGIATFSNLSVPATGTYTLTASSSGAVASSNSFTISAGPPVGIVVTTNSDAVSHSGISLRNAITTANADAAAGQVVTITFASSVNGQTITLSQGTLNLTGLGAGSVTIDGSATAPITVSGADSQEVFNVGTNVSVAISNLTIANGHANYSGGGIFNAGTLALTNDVLTANASGYDGGGLYNTGTATLTNVTLSDNSAPGGSLNGGGGAFNTGSMTVAASTFTDNTTSFNGAGVDNTCTMTVTNSTFSGNVGGWGALETDNGKSTVVGCTFTGNHANDGGAAVALSNSGTTTVVTMIDCTITGNTSQGSGGAIWTNNLTSLAVNLVNCTISGNTGTTSAGGLFFWTTGTVATLSNTIVANNMVGSSTSDISGAVSGNNNLIGNGTGMTGITNGTNGNQVGTSSSPINPLLNSLSNNGGPTQTMSEQTGSPAIGAGGADTTLGAAVSNATTPTITIADLSRLDASAQPALSSGSYFTIQIDSEQMAVTGASAYTLTVVRGVNGTTAVAHASGAVRVRGVGSARYLVPANSPPVLDVGAYQSIGSVVLTTVTSVNPNNGNPSGGTSVVITGTNFTGATAVNFGAFAATSFTVNSDSQITAIDPAGSGVVNVTVVTPNGTSATSSADQFTYNAPTTTSLTSNPVGPITQGTPITFTANITGDPSVGTVSFYYDYGAGDQFQIGSAVNVINGSATSASTAGLPVGSDTITAIYGGGVGFQGSTGTLIIQVTAPPPNITNVVINQDISSLYNAAGQSSPGTQRSMVEDIVYTFSEAVNIASPAVDPNVFTVAVAPGWTGTVPTTVEWAPVAGSGDTQWEVDFGVNPNASGSQTGALASITNGAYTITVTDPSSITAQRDSQSLNLAAGGINGATQSFYRLFGDISADGFVNAADNYQLKIALMTYNPAFDYYQYGVVNACDNWQFKADQSVNFSGFTATI